MKIVFVLLTTVVTSFGLLTTTGATLSGENPRSTATKPAPGLKRYLYVVTPGVRNYLGYGGHGIQVFDIDNGHRFVKFIAGKGGLKKDGTPSNVKGVDVSLTTNCLYVSTLEAIQCIDLTTEKLIWERPYDGGVDRLSISPDGKIIYVPSLEKEFWTVVDAKTGNHSGKQNKNDFHGKNGLSAVAAR